MVGTSEEDGSEIESLECGFDRTVPFVCFRADRHEFFTKIGGKATRNIAKKGGDEGGEAVQDIVCKAPGPGP